MEADKIEKVISLASAKMPTQLQISGIPSANRHAEEQIDFKFDKKCTRLVAEYKSEPRLMDLPYLRTRKADTSPLVIVAMHISTSVKEELRREKINYLDAAGNLYLAINSMYIFIDGQKKESMKEEVKNRAFTKTGLKVVFAFLQDPEIINLPYRTISEKIDVSLDTVHNVINGLKDLGYIISIVRKELALINIKQLLLRWIQEYEIKLKPSLFIGSFRFVKNDDIVNWNEIELNVSETQWGGEPAGALITNHLRPAEFTIYTSKKRLEIMKELKLLPDPNGNLKLYKKFWINNEDENAYVPEILAYTDLLNHGDPRNLEIAERIYEQHIQDRFK
ncbi:hypothetical protein AAKU52_003096 [Pedobacter sp. CG_S7]|uniref:type IV toxin-antitoxin system AbiEi family antitoxin n=1 Tax=Pedobacter sp. CG_S7 TaxID=3143930 RepID=UPI0033908A26